MICVKNGDVNVYGPVVDVIVEIGLCASAILSETPESYREGVLNTLIETIKYAGEPRMIKLASDGNGADEFSGMISAALNYHEEEEE